LFERVTGRSDIDIFAKMFSLTTKICTDVSNGGGGEENLNTYVEGADFGFISLTCDCKLLKLWFSFRHARHSIGLAQKTPNPLGGTFLLLTADLLSPALTCRHRSVFNSSGLALHRSRAPAEA